MGQGKRSHFVSFRYTCNDLFEYDTLNTHEIELKRVCRIRVLYEFVFGVNKNMSTRRRRRRKEKQKGVKKKKREEEKIRKRRRK